MANKRHKPEEIVQKLRQVDVLVGQGVQRVDAIREVRITEQTYCRWRQISQPQVLSEETSLRRAWRFHSLVG